MCPESRPEEELRRLLSTIDYRARNSSLGRFGAQFHHKSALQSEFWSQIRYLRLNTSPVGAK